MSITREEIASAFQPILFAKTGGGNYVWEAQQEREQALEGADRVLAHFKPLQEALDLALDILGAMEPGDSRAVSNHYVAMACVAAGKTDDEVMRCIRETRALLTLKAEGGE
jgi:hypothetical protein